MQMTNHIDFSNDREMYAYCAELDAKDVRYTISIFNSGQSTVHHF